MSETQSLQTEAEAPAPEPEVPAVAPETPVAEAPPAPEPTEAEKAAAARETKKQEDIRKRINALTRRGAEAERERDALRAERDAMKALLESRNPPAEPETPRPAPTALPDDVIQARARELRDAERFQERTRDLISKGAKELGADTWNEKTGILAEMGATNNQAFMQALAELPDAHKLVAYLADDLDVLNGLLARGPVAMAAEMGRITAAITAPAPRTLSAAPKPAASVSGRAAADPDVYDGSLSMAEYVKLRRKQAPASLGGEKARR
ncbi:MAG: hypothetical protein B7Z66_15320 [Chromatiales bacterium 21-64-14]|nr:MAG: hypothetical protein B7Z66_15320 [Chromatiales bacterium 21-64-14]